MSFGGFADDSPQWDLPAGDIVSDAIKNNAIKKEKLIR